MRALLAYKRGEPRVCAMVKAPTPKEEDRRQIGRDIFKQNPRPRGETLPGRLCRIDHFVRGSLASTRGRAVPAIHTGTAHEVGAGSLRPLILCVSLTVERR